MRVALVATYHQTAEYASSRKVVLVGFWESDALHAVEGPSHVKRCHVEKLVHVFTDPKVAVIYLCSKVLLLLVKLNRSVDFVHEDFM